MIWWGLVGGELYSVMYRQTTTTTTTTTTSLEGNSTDSTMGLQEVQHTSEVVLLQHRYVHTVASEVEPPK